MCGIAGIWGAADAELIRRMTDVIAHRGPDDSGVKVYEDGSQAVSLGHRRLSIIDLSPAGHQPMTNEDGTLWITFNGEIYNFPALREELVAAGHRFRSRTDTEVLLHGYEEWGTSMVRRLNGIFAFALWDASRRALHLVRDRYGVKPLYYLRQDTRLFFGSEIKSLLCVPEVDRALDPDALLAYLRFRYCPEPDSLFKSVRKVPPGHWMTFGAEGESDETFYELKYPVEPHPESEQVLAERLLEILTQATHRQMISDVPVGLFLSGGLDSSGLLALARNHTAKQLKTFTIGFRHQDQRFEGQPDDVTYARELARSYQTDHQEIILEPNIVDLLPKVIWHLDDPIADPAAITSYLICRAAREQGTKVLLSGQGGDEVFCGYPWHLAMQIARYYGRLPEFIRAPLEKLVARLPAARGGALTGTLRRLRKFCSSASLEFDERLIGFLAYAGADNLQGLLGERFGDPVDIQVADRAHQALLKQSRGWHPINRMLHLDMGTFLPGLNLTYTDKTSMAFGVEVRVPYIDNEVVDFMGRVPPDLKMRGTTRKYLMKRAYKDLLPPQILHRKKAGFGAPIRTWIVADLKDMINDLLSERNLKSRGYFDPAYVRRLISENAAGRHDYNYLIYILLSFELWCRVYQDGPVPEVSSGFATVS